MRLPERAAVAVRGEGAERLRAVHVVFVVPAVVPLGVEADEAGPERVWQLLGEARDEASGSEMSDVCLLAATAVVFPMLRTERSVSRRASLPGRRARDRPVGRGGSRDPEVLVAVAIAHTGRRGIGGRPGHPLDTRDAGARASEADGEKQLTLHQVSPRVGTTRSWRAGEPYAQIRITKQIVCTLGKQIVGGIGMARPGSAEPLVLSVLTVF